MNTSLEQPAPYDVLSRVYDRWVRQTDHDRMAGRIMAIGAAAGASASCLDVCCGTGTLAATLARSGYRVTGIDGSRPMLALASHKINEQGLAGRVAFECVDVARDAWRTGRVDLVTCTFDSVNYFSNEAFSTVARNAYGSLSPGGVFVFDINTEHKLRTMFGNSVYAETFDDYAYIWKNALDEQARTIDFTITMFLRQTETLYERHVEAHRQYLHSDRSIRTVLEASRFATVDAWDDYSDVRPHETSLRVTYVARRIEA